MSTSLYILVAVSVLLQVINFLMLAENQRLRRERDKAVRVMFDHLLAEARKNGNPLVRIPASMNLRDALLQQDRSE